MSFSYLAPDDHDLVPVMIDDKRHMLPNGGNLAAALLANNWLQFHRGRSHQPKRGPYCMIGNCFDCIMMIDGKSQAQACMTIIEKNMIIHTRDGLPQLHIKDGDAHVK